jgi:hypothetical protein
MMARALQQRQQAQGTDFTGRLPPSAPSADPRMVVAPTVNPGYAMPIPDDANTIQGPNVPVTGTLPASLSGVVVPGGALQAPDLRYQQWLQMQMQNYVRQQMAQGQTGTPQSQPQQ